MNTAVQNKSNNQVAATNLEIIDGTSSIHTYLVVQHKKEAILAIKPELHVNYEGVHFLFRNRIIADQFSTKGISDRPGYCKAIYPKFEYTKNDQKRATFYIDTVLGMDALMAFTHAEYGKQLLGRLVYKLVLATVNHIQSESGAPFDDQVTAINWLHAQFMQKIESYFDFNHLDDETVSEIEQTDIGELFKLPFSPQ